MKSNDRNRCAPAQLSRRSMLLGSIGAGLSLPTLWAMPSLAVDFVAPVAESVGMSVYSNSGMVVVRWDNTPIAVYRADAGQKVPHFSTLTGLESGLPLITISSAPYPHHRGLWLGCEPLNGGDYWSDGPLEDGQIASLQLEAGEVDNLPHAVRIKNACTWKTADGGNPLSDRRTITYRRHSNKLAVMDVLLELTANADIAIDHAKHSFFALRAAADIVPLAGGHLVNSNGQSGASETQGQAARWCGFYGQRAQRPGLVEGITILNHPENFGGECPWFTRDYGHLSPSPFAFLTEEWKLKEGEVLTLRYGVALHSGSPQEAGMDTVYEEWVTKEVPPLATARVPGAQE